MSVYIKGRSSAPRSDPANNHDMFLPEYRWPTPVNALQTPEPRRKGLKSFGYEPPVKDI